MRLNIYGSPTEQHIERYKTGKQLLAATPSHNHQNSRNAYMRTGECRRRAFTHLLRAFHQTIKKSVLIARSGKQLLIIIEIITNSRENTFRYIINTNGRKIELRACNRNEYTKVGARRCSFFYAPTSSLFLFRLTTNINFALIRSQLYNHTIRSIFRRTAIETIYLFQR